MGKISRLQMQVFAIANSCTYFDAVLCILDQIKFNPGELRVAQIGCYLDFEQLA
jgi:hypothetical protein